MKLIQALVSGLILAILGSGVAAKTLEQWAAQYGIRDDASYDAVRVMETKDGSFRFKERKAPQKSQMEIAMGGIQGIMIRRDDLDTAYFVMPEMGMYRTLKNQEASQQAYGGMQVSKVEEVGRETINGHPSRKFKTRFKDDNGKGAGFMWITDHGIPIKLDMIYKNRGMKGQRMKMELTDLNVRSQDASHFELPPNLQPMTMGAMMGMAQRMQQQTGSNSANRTPANEEQGPSLAEDVGDAAKDETRRGVISETRNAVREGIRGLFRR